MSGRRDRAIAAAEQRTALLCAHAEETGRHLIHLPVHASWLDQAEIYFIVQRKVVSPNDFTSLDQIRDRLGAFEIRYNAVARPFSWKFTRTGLDDLMHRIDAHDRTQPRALAA